MKQLKNCGPNSHLECMPTEIILEIFSYVDMNKGLASASILNKLFSHIMGQPQVIGHLLKKRKIDWILKHPLALFAKGGIYIQNIHLNKNTNLTIKDTKFIVKKCPNLQGFCFKGTSTDTITRVLADGLSSLTSLKIMNEIKNQGNFFDQLLKLTKLQKLEIFEKFNSTLIEKLSNLKSLKFLDVGYGIDNNKDLDTLTKVCKSFRHIYLRGYGDLTDNGCQYLTRLDSIESLEIRSAKTTGEMIKYITHFTSLQSLLISQEYAYTDTNFKNLSNLTRLKNLTLNCCYAITDEGIQQLTNLSHLVSLHIGYCSSTISDESIQQLTNLSHLTSLHIAGKETHITNQSIEQIKNLKYLKEFEIGTGTKITQAGLKKLRANNITVKKTKKNFV